MRRLVFALLFAVAAAGVAEGSRVLWFPFDHLITSDCRRDCYPGHTGVDYACDSGTSLYAPIAGTVVARENGVSGQVCDEPNYGNYIKIQNDEYQMRVIEAHMLMGSIVVSVGEVVSAGQYIGQSSNSGYTFNMQGQCGQGGGFHLHLETQVLIGSTWTPVDPYTYDGGLWTEPLLYGNQNPPTYACQLKDQSQSPSGTIPMHPGETFTCQVQYWNRGNTTWDKVPPNGYIELKAVLQNGNLDSESFLQDGSWINFQSPCTMQESSVAPGQLATFTFTGRVPDDASPGMNYAWFRPNHSDAVPSLLSDWGGLSFNVNVVIEPPSEPGPAVDAVVMDWVTGDLHIGLNANRVFDPDGYWETGWIHGASANDFRLFTSGSNADVYQDLCALSVRLGNWDELTTNGYDFYTHRQLLSNWKAYTGGDQKHQYFMADATGDGKPDAIHVATHTGVASVARRSGNLLVPDANVWITSFRDGALNTHQFFAGDVTGDGKADLLAREVSTGNWYLAKSTGSSFTTSGITNPVLTNWTADALTNLEFQILLADIDADGRDELICYRPVNGSVSWCDWNDVSFTKKGTLTTNWGVSSEPYRYRLLSGDLNKDWRDDLVLFKADGGNWYGGLSTGTSLTDRHTWREDFGNSTDQTRYRPYLFDVGTTGSYRLPVDSLGAGAAGGLAFRVVPNPARGAIELWFDHPQTAVASLQVFDLQGRLLRSITDPSSLEGNPLWWDGRTSEAQAVPAGVYFLRISTPTRSLTRTVTVVR